MTLLWHEYRRKGLCGQCGEPAERGKSLCLPHMLAKRRYQADYVARQQSAKLCVRCSRFAAPGKTLCKKHAAEQKLRDQWRYEAKRTAILEGIRDLKERRRAAGLCTLCGGKPVTGRVLCRRCAKKRRLEGAAARKRRSHGTP